MFVADNTQLIQMLLEQMSADAKVDSVNLIGEQDRMLFGLLEMITLKLISGAYSYGKSRDPIGLALSSASGILLTKRGLIFSER